MIKNILGADFKYEDDKMYRLSKLTNKWCCCNVVKINSTGYISSRINKKQYLLHRLIYKYHNEDWDITNISRDNMIDHIDINPLNNKIENLRIVNQSQNCRNRNKQKNCSSIYKGVSWHKTHNKWMTQIRINGKIKTLGYFINEDEAGEAYQKKYTEIMNF